MKVNILIIIYIYISIISYFVFYLFNLFQNQRAVNIFDIISGNTEINHPLCEECTDTLLDIMDQHLRMIDDDCLHYKLYLQK